MKTYSYSRLGTYGTCPLQYKYKYIDKTEIDVGPTVEAFVGSMVHETLEWLYSLVHSCKVPSLEETLADYRRRWESAWRDDTRIVSKHLGPKNYFEVGEKALGMYYRRHHPFDTGIIIGLEQYFKFQLDEEHAIMGYIDRLGQAEGGAIEVHDYKTSKSLPPLREAMDDRQGGVYTLAVQELFPDAAEIRLIWHYLRHDRPVLTTRSPEQLRVLKEELLEQMLHIESAREFPAQESALCNWCDFYTICPAKGHRIKVGSLAPNEFLNEPGVQLVDRLAELEDQLKRSRKELEEIIGNVKEALIAYAAREGTSVVVGSDKEAVITREKKVSFPGKRKPGRAELEVIVKEFGLWNDVSDLNTLTLDKLVRHGSLDALLVERLRELGSEGESVRVRLRRRKNEVE